MIELANYNKVVAQRNKLLKEISFSGRMADTLEIWDEQMVRYGTSIISERKKFISRLNDILSEIHQNLTGGKEQILITYEPNVSEEAFSEELKAGRERIEGFLVFHRIFFTVYSNYAITAYIDDS